MNKLLLWIGAGLKKLYPVSVEDRSDPLGAICRTAVARHRWAKEENRQASAENVRAMNEWLATRHAEEQRSSIFN